MSPYRERVTTPKLPPSNGKRWRCRVFGHRPFELFVERLEPRSDDLWSRAQPTICLRCCEVRCNDATQPETEEALRGFLAWLDGRQKVARGA